jgi:hypothetical protein
MEFRQRLVQFIGKLTLDRMGLRHSLNEHVVLLENSSESIAQRIAVIEDTHNNRVVLGHVIGIERWCQSRLKVALGEPLVMDDYDSYRPHHSQDITALRGAFQTTRTETIALARKLAVAKIDPSVKIPHNMYGNLSVYGWLHYIRIHATMESKRVQ